MTNLIINRLNLLMATKRLMQVSPTSYNSELMFKAIDGKLALVAFGEGIIGIECLPDKADIDEDVVVNLEKFHVFLQVRYEDTISIKVNPKSVKLSAGSSSSTIGRSVLRLQAGIPDKSLFVGEIPSKAFDDLVRVANISDDKDMARPILGGVYLTITPGDIRAISANGIAFGYAWEQGSGISTEKKERFLIKATAASAAQRYDWQGEPKIKIYRPSDSLKMMCFSNGLSYLYISELAEKEKFPIDYLLDGANDAVSDNYFTVDSGLFRSFVDAAVRSSGYDDRSVTVALANGKVMISSGKRLKPEIEEQGMEFVGFFEIMEAGSFGGDFVFCLDAKMAKQMMALLAQVDKGKLRVALGKRTKLIFFSTPMANALYGITQIAR
jgi:hypothetical protein